MSGFVEVSSAIDDIMVVIVIIQGVCREYKKIMFSWEKSSLVM